MVGFGYSSTEGISDPLHFETPELVSTAFVFNEVQDPILRADVETIKAIFSNTLACVFSVLQIFHLRRNPNVVSFVSMIIPKLVFLVVGLKPNKSVKGVIKVAFFLFQSRLLQHTWLVRRSSHGDNEGLQMAEKEAMFVTLRVYAELAFLSRRKRNHEIDSFLLPQIFFKLFRDSREISLAYSYYIGTTLVCWILPNAYGFVLLSCLDI
ncbi:hypothetical protein F8388_006594 [Cannabis sativa]|uniref:RING-type E3 ubiquitin transferase n=1 Tax=Cannabis sativa TaxID=3483 RepID=A0A7J6HC84_CANSA|nr:hypothetical protein F8388_006594 [Cannabis sativa]KAF4392936.1 hypothetical protein G4B88_011931 [Cannabis sativa]